MKLIKFEQVNCHPCKMVETYMKDTLNFSVDEVIDVSKKDKETKALLRKYKVQATPTLLLVDNEEKEISRVIGMSPDDISKICKLRNTSK